MVPTDFATHAETVALFRYGLIADLRDVRAGDRSLHARLEEKADREYDIPGTTRRRDEPGEIPEQVEFVSECSLLLGERSYHVGKCRRLSDTMAKCGCSQSSDVYLPPKAMTGRVPECVESPRIVSSTGRRVRLVAAIILCPETYMSWLFDNSTLILYDTLYMDRRDYDVQQQLASRSTLDHKVAKFLKLLHDELRVLRLVSYSDSLSDTDRARLHAVAREYCVSPANAVHVARIGRQAWGYYVDYLAEKLVRFDDPSEPGVQETVRKRKDTATWFDRLFRPDGSLRKLTDEETAALQNGVTRTLAKALASVRIYQSIAWQYPQQQFLLHERREYDHAFTVAADLGVTHFGTAMPQLVDGGLESPGIAGDLLYDCYREYCVQFDGCLIEKPDLLFQVRREFEDYRRITDDLKALHGTFLQASADG